MVEVTETINEVIELLDSRRFLHGHRETMKESLRIALEAALASPAEVVEPMRSEWPHLVQLGRTLGMFASAIKSGEPWSDMLQQEYDLANQAAKDIFADLKAHPPQQEPERLREALESIARNTCCDSCQEAALVARAALARAEE